MASISGCRTARASLLALPPHLRVHAYQTTKRQFSASAPRKVSLVEAAVSPFTTLLDLLHTTGLPWFAVIPLSAVVARGIIVYYVSYKPTRRNNQTHALLLPVNSTRIILANGSESTRRQRELSEKNLEAVNYSERGKASEALSSAIYRWRVKRRVLHQLGKSFGAPYWQPGGWMGFAMLISMTEAIRVKAGAREGLLPLLLSPLQTLGEGMVSMVEKWTGRSFSGRGDAATASVESAGAAAVPEVEAASAISTAPPEPTPDQLASSDSQISSAAEELQSTISAATDTSQQVWWSGVKSLFTGKPSATETIQNPDTQLLEDFTNATESSWSSAPTPDQLASSNSALSSAAEGAQPALETSTTAVEQAAESASQLLPHARYFDPTMQTEGLWWALDLTQPDPSLILPVSLCCLMSWNIFSSALAVQRRRKALAAAKPAPKTSDQPENVPRAPEHPLLKNLSPEAKAVLESKRPHTNYRLPITNLQRIQLSLIMMFFVVTLKMPAGIMLYMVSSQLVARVQRAWMDVRMPMRQGVAPCKRPLRYRVRKEWDD